MKLEKILNFGKKMFLSTCLFESLCLTSCTMPQTKLSQNWYQQIKTENKTKASKTEKEEKKEEKRESLFSLGLKPRFEFWSAERTETEIATDENIGSFDSETVEKDRGSGILIGPEIEYLYKNLFTRAFYFQGQTKFSNGEGDRKHIGVDVGYGGFDQKLVGFLGYRGFIADLSDLKNNELEDHSVHDGVLGVLFRTTPYESGFNASFEMDFGLSGLLTVSDDEQFAKAPLTFESQLGLGYRFKNIPLSVGVGYGVWVSGTKVGEREVGGELIDKVIERMDSWGHGGILNITYSF